MSSQTKRRDFESLPFVWAAVIAALLGGFGLITGMLVSLLSGAPTGAWWMAGVQAHGHAQLMGWAGLMVFGIGFYFFPRLRGAPLAWPHLMQPCLWLLAGGLAVRVAGQPVLASMGSAPPLAMWLVLAASAAAETAGACVAVAMLVGTHWQGGDDERPALQQVLPLLGVSFAAYVAASALNLAGAVAASLEESAILPPPLASASIQTALLGFLLPVAIAVSARFFPLYLGTRPPSGMMLRTVLLLLLSGLAARLLAPTLAALGDFLVGAGAAAAIWLLFRPAEPVKIESPRPVTPRPYVPPPASQVARAHARSAYAWLAVAATIALANSVSGWTGVALPQDAERHAIGAGYITLLIIGMGTLLLPGFLRGSAPARPVRLALWFGNAAALLRVAPPLLSAVVPSLLPGHTITLLLAVAGGLGTATIICFGIVVWHTSRRPPRRAATRAAT